MTCEHWSTATANSTPPADVVWVKPLECEAAAPVRELQPRAHPMTHFCWMCWSEDCTCDGDDE
jgi:hypothetical protein